MFTLADSKTSPNFDFLGVVIISMALLCDAVIGNVQEKAMKQFKASNNEVNPMTMYVNIFLLSVSGYMGLQAVLGLVRLSGAPVAVTVTTMRKALSIVFSFLLFSKPFVAQLV
ncbi:Adenosine 3'-phospho 5'-phosphosulfate transporter 2 [Eumeta japonica]|uniref:Adenosine 3'-phospho 5'-phosphosulfate transporter 2 n=1 Tax=Eumeta variegata TaxID=151549 RepID=A0A4C1TZ80_EUMVA|nr:Adenosine 3'-phospho 5'-phosphosulfate transporter 2 [Eumeta japonica]